MCKANRTTLCLGMLVVLILGAFAMTAAAPGGRKDAASEDSNLSEQQYGQSKTLALADFDSDVARCRREMRKYCAIVQQILEKTEGASRQRASLALKHLQGAQQQWSIIITKYRNNPPAEYATHPRFPARLSEIDHAMEDMKRQLKAGRAKQSFSACARACGFFVRMHEENGLIYALDRIFHLRKIAKTAIAAGKNKGPLTVSKFLPDLLYHRNRIVLASCPWPDDTERCEDYRASVNTLSSMLNDLAAGVVNRNLSEIDRILKELLKTISNTYGKAL